jgi:hypothetical protein
MHFCAQPPPKLLIHSFSKHNLCSSPHTTCGFFVCFIVYLARSARNWPEQLFEKENL